MARTRMVPRGARRLRSYAEFESYLVDFVEGRYPFLWVVGRPGVAKSESVKRAIQRATHYYRKGGQLTPLRFFIEAFHHRGQPIILDDADPLLDTKLGAKLIAALGDSSPARQMSYGTTSRALGEVPSLYYTTSNLCILANKAPTDEAILSRAVLIYFNTTNADIHRRAAQWFWDQEIHDWVGQHVSQLDPIDVRWYGIAAPKATPAAIVGKLNVAINTALAEPAAKARLADLGVEPMVMTPEQCTAFIAAEHAKWDKVIRAADIKLD